MRKRQVRYAAIALAVVATCLSTSRLARAETSTSPSVVAVGAAVHGNLPGGAPATTFVPFQLGPDVKGPVTIELRSLDFDTALQISIAGPKGTTTSVASDDDGGVGTDSALILMAVPNQVYKIEVRATDDDWGGAFDLLVSGGRRPALDESAKRTADEAYFHSVIAHASQTEGFRRQVRILKWWSIQLANAQKYDEALKTLDKAIALRAERLRSDPDRSVDDLIQRSVILRKQRMTPEAKSALKEALDLTEKAHSGESLEVISLLATASEQLTEMGDSPGAKAHLERAIVLARRSGVANAQKTLPKLWMSLAYLQWKLEDAKEAERSFRAAIEAADATWGSGSRIAGTAAFSIAGFFRVEGRYQEALDYGRRALTIHESQPVPEETAIAYVLKSLGQTYVLLDRAEEAEEALLRGIAICDEQAKHTETPLDPRLLIDMLCELGNLYHDLGRYREAQPLLERAGSLSGRVVAQDTLFWDDAGGRVDTSRRVRSLESLANIYHWQSKYKESEPLYRKALEMREESLAADHPKVALSLGNLGKVLTSLGRASEALPLLERSIAILEARYGADSPLVVTQVERLAEAYVALDRDREATEAREKILAIREQKAPGTGVHATALNNLALLYMDQGRLREAQNMLQRAVEISVKVDRAEHSQTGTFLQNYGLVESHMKNFRKAEDLQTRALKIRRKAFGDVSPDVGHTLQHLGWLYRDWKRDAKAERSFRDALRIYEATLGPEHPTTGFCRRDLIKALRRNGRTQEADALEAAAKFSGISTTP